MECFLGLTRKAVNGQTHRLSFWFGPWRSLVAHFAGGEGVAGSNPVGPTNFPNSLLPNRTKICRQKDRHFRMKRWIWPLLLGITIFTASSSNSFQGPDMGNFDKMVHLLVFGLVGVLVLRSRKPISWSWAFVSILLVSCYGAMDEFRQSFTPGRTVEGLDWMADTLGASVSILLYRMVPMYATLLELKLPSKTGQARPNGK